MPSKNKKLRPEQVEAVRRIVDLRLRREWTRRHLAERAGIAHTTMSRIEMNGAPVGPYVTKLAKVFGVTEAFILEGRTPPLTDFMARSIATGQALRKSATEIAEDLMKDLHALGKKIVDECACGQPIGVCTDCREPRCYRCDPHDPAVFVVCNESKHAWPYGGPMSRSDTR